MRWLGGIALAASFVPSIGFAQFEGSQRAWQGEIQHRFPGNHLEWLSNASYDEIIAAYYRHLPGKLRRRAGRIANYAHRCASETAGLTCEWAAHIAALWKLERLPDFAD